MTGVPEETPEPADSTLDLRARVVLSHARIAHLLDAAGLRGLHVKGYAAETGVYAERRASSDVDLVVHPDDAERVVGLLGEHGWRRVTDFSEGSIFGHAATLWHDHLGYVDVHRLFPGLGPDPAATFERLWAEHTARVIAGHPVPVPSPRHQRLVVIVHAARDGGRGRTDVEHLRTSSTAAEWEGLRTEARALGASGAWSVATEEGGGDPDDADLRLFTALRDHESGFDLFRTRWRSAPSVRARARLVLGTVPVNRPHLQMRLGRPVTRVDVLREQGNRMTAVLGWLAGKAARRGR